MKRLTGHRTPTLLRALLAAVILACSSETEPLQAPPVLPSTTLEAITPTSVTATVGTAVLPSPAVRVRDGEGRPKAGVEVRFVLRYLTDIEQTSARTGPDGIASVPWMLGHTAGVGSATASVPGAADIVFRGTGVAGPVARIEQFGGNDQFALTGAAIEPVHIRVLDVYRNPIAGTLVRFTVAQGGGSLTRDTASTNVSGYASSGHWVLGEAGANRLIASAGSISSPFTATAVTPASGAIDAVYDLASIDGERAVELSLTGTLSLTVAGKFTAVSQFISRGTTTTTRSTGQYAIAAPRLLLNVEAGDWKKGSMIGDLGIAPSQLLLTFEGDEYDSVWTYLRRP